MERGHARHRSEQIGSYGAPQQYYPPQRPAAGKPYSYPRDYAARPHDQRVDEGRAWSGTAQGVPPPAPSNPPSSNFFIPPHQAASNVVSHSMLPPQELSRRRSIGGALSPPHFAAGPGEPYTTFHPRAMPPPSPPSTAVPSHGSDPYGPPGASPFTGIRDLASMTSSRRSGGGMSISSILGGATDEKRQTVSMRPPSPGRARASSMRESYVSAFTDQGSGRDAATPRSATHTSEAGRVDFDGRTERGAGNELRAYYEPPRNGAYPGRATSQPRDYQPPTLLNEVSHKSDETGTGRAAMFRSFASTDQSREPRLVGSQTSWATADRSAFSSPGADKVHRDVFSPTYPGKHFAPPAPEEQATLFRPAYPQIAQESIEQKPRDTGRATPPFAYHNGLKNGYHERPLTYEEHQRMEAAGGRFELQRKDSDPRSLFNISPELRRRGRDSPLPQAVQGAQPRHIGPGGDHPSIKSEFGRMFSGLGAGVGSVTPVGGQSMNGHGTPTRIVSPIRPGDMEYIESPIGEDGPRSASARPAKKQGYRRPRDEMEAEKYDGRMTPSLSQRGNKRAKTVHPLHHHHHHHHHTTHHHHHHDVPEQAGSYGMIRFSSNPLLQTQPVHRHHHHHHAHGHKHGSLPIASLKKPSMIVQSKAVLESAATKPRKHLGSMPYRAMALDINEKTSPDYHILYTSQAELIPKFTGQENSTYTVRVPRWYVTRSAGEAESGDHARLEEVCRSRHLWGTDIYTDDSNVIAAAVHSGWLRGNFGYATDDLESIDRDDYKDVDSTMSMQLDSKPKAPARIPEERDVHITILILPTLEAYTGSHQHHVQSRDWKGVEPHDGMSYMIHSIRFVDEGREDRGEARSIASRKARMALAAKRRSMPAGLASRNVSVGVQVAF